MMIMKTKIFYLLMAACVAFTSCDNKNEQPAAATIEIKGIDGFVLDKAQTIHATATTQPKVGVEITAPGKIASLTCQIVSEYPAFSAAALAAMGMTDKFDLVNPGALAPVLTGLGLPNGDAVLGKTSLKVDVSSFIPMITMLYNEAAGSFDVSFVIAVEDEAGTKASSSMMLHVEK
jgi:hypothetical protein